MSSTAIRERGPLVPDSIFAHSELHFSKLPKGWRTASRKYWDRVNRSVAHEIRAKQRSQGGRLSEAQAFEIKREEQEMRWERITGVPARDSHFTLVIPIHNEENYLTATLESVLLSDIPTSVKMNVVLVTNACTDNGMSAEIANSAMSDVGTVTRGNIRSIGASFPDANMSREYSSVKHDGLRVMHLDTPTPGKANALNIGNAIASGRDDVAMCLDSNAFVEPDSIAHLFRAAQAEFATKSGRSAIVAPGYIKHDQPEKIHDLPEELQQIDALRNITNAPAILPTQFTHGWRTRMTGGFFAWNPQVLLEIGGMPNVAVEDTALVWKAARKGFGIDRAPHASIWIIPETTVRSRMQQLIRYTKGFLQLLDQHPELSRLVGNMQLPFLMEPSVREVALRKWASQELGVSDSQLDQCVAQMQKLWGEIVAEGRAQFKANPHDASWTGVDGTS